MRAQPLHRGERVVVELNDLLAQLNAMAMSLPGRSLRFQPFWESMLDVVTVGMNIGYGGAVDETERFAIREVCKRLPPESVIFDVGANVGDYAAAVLEFASPVHLFCFEPSNAAFRKLSTRLVGTESPQTSARLASNSTLRLFNIGFSNKDGQCVLYGDVPGSPGASVYCRKVPHWNIDFQPQETAQFMTIDNFCKQEAIDRIALLKVDVEGHELAVLQGASGMLDRQAIDFVQFEFGETHMHAKTYFRDFYYLLKDRYRLFRLVPDGFYPLDLYWEKYEIFRYGNFMAVSRNRPWPVTE